MRTKPTYTGLVVLELSKLLMHDFHYNNIQGQYGSDKARLLCIYINVLHSYNNTRHRFTGLTPTEVTPSADDEQFFRPVSDLFDRSSMYADAHLVAHVKLPSFGGSSRARTTSSFAYIDDLSKRVTSETGRKNCPSSALVCPLYR